jgi:hypothetical protein
VSDRRVRRQLALGAVQLLLLITAALSSGAIARAQDEPPALTLTMTADKETLSAVGEVITVTYALTNTGTVALDGVTVTDTKVEEHVGCQSLFLEPGQSVSCTGSYAITQADLDAGSVTNIAQGFGRVSESTTIVFSNEASLTIAALGLAPASLTLELEAYPATFSAVDDVIVYTYTLTNTGGVALDVLSVIDTMVEVVFCPYGPLEPGGSFLCTSDYFITQADLDAGSVTNFATSYGTYGEGEEVASEEASLTITATALASEPAAMTLEMGAAGGVTTFGAVDDLIVYVYQLTNTGGVALDVVSVTPELGDVRCGSGPLEPGGTLICVGSYAITQADLDAGSVTNFATSYGTYGEGEEVASEEASLTITATALASEPAALTLELGSVATTFDAVDDRIEYDYVLTNTGGVALDAVSVTPVLGDVVCPLRPVEAGGAVLCVGYYYITQADLDAGSVSNTAWATGTYGGSEEVTSDEVSLTITAEATEP